MRCFCEILTFPVQFCMFPPWIAHWSILPWSTAPFLRSNSTYSGLQYIPATSRGVWPTLLGLFKIGSWFFKSDKYKGKYSELWEHIWWRAVCPELSNWLCNFSFKSKNGTNLPYVYYSYRYTCVFVWLTFGLSSRYVFNPSFDIELWFNSLSVEVLKPSLSYYLLIKLMISLLF